jgi:predicted MFS family arabinose efflux permease
VWLIGLRAIFFAIAFTMLLCLLVVVLFVPETKPEPEEGDARPRMLAPLRDRRLLLLTLGTALAITVYVQFDSVLGVFLHRERGYALATWGLVFGVSPLLVAATQYFVARWAGRRSPRRMLALGAVLEGVAMFILWPTSVLPVLVVAVVVVTVGEMILQPIASTVAADLAPPSLRGSYEALVGVAFAASWAPAVFTGLTLVGSGHGEVMLAVALPIGLLAAACFARLPTLGGGVDDGDDVLNVAVAKDVGEPAP